MEKIKFEISKEHAIVLFEFLCRLNSEKFESENIFEDQSEQRVLWDLESLLEKYLSETLSGDYQKKLEKARNNIRDEE
jgi:hypothetical protein